MKHLTWVVTGAVGICLAAPCLAQKPVVYPAKGQSAQRQSQDDGECYSWAKQNTGIDPAAPPAAAPQSGPKGERARGAARGAAAGAIIGEAGSGDASHGAKVGAAAGVVAGGSRSRRNKAAEAQATQV